MLHHRYTGRYPIPVAVAPEAIRQAAAGQTVAVRYLDSVDAGRIESGGDCSSLPWGNPVTESVHAVAQGDILHAPTTWHLRHHVLPAGRNGVCDLHGG